MKLPKSPLEGRLQVVRNLAISAYSTLLHIGKLREQFGDQAELSRVNGYVFKAKRRYDSCRTLLETVEPDSHNDAVAALAESFLSYVRLIDETLEEAGLETLSDPYHKACDSIVLEYFPESTFSETVHDATTLKNSTRLPSLLQPHAPDSVVYWLCVKLAMRFAANIQLAKTDGFAQIVREIRFPPEYQQAGLSILNYFATVLSDKYPDIPITVSIQQRHDVVTLTITHPDGSQETISRALNDYGLVVTGQMTPREFISDDFRAMALQQKLEVAQLEVRQARDLLRLQDQYSSKRIESLEAEVKGLYSLLAREFSSRDKLQDGLLALTAKMNSGQIGEHAVSLIRALAEAFTERNAERTKIILEDIQTSQPGLFARLNDFFLEAAASGVIGNYAYDWLKVIWPVVPK